MTTTRTIRVYTNDCSMENLTVKNYAKLIKNQQPKVQEKK